jgi:UDPglucose--hexose-1-phosphate uridylyltransferase
MSELRRDPINGRWVIISSERAKRPFAFTKTIQKEEKETSCPLCPGNEDKTPPEITAIREPGSQKDQPGWKIRVVPNKFPALRIENELEKEGEGMYDKISGFGAHEVIIESPNHKDLPSTISIPQFKNILLMFRERILDLKKDTRFKYIMIFKNQGEGAGASLSHPHTQLIALPVIPKSIVEELRGSKEYYGYKERCIFCDIIRQEIFQGVRIVSENNGFISIAPFASRYPFETWILPKKHNSTYENMDEVQYQHLAEIFSDTLKRLDRAVNYPPYNYILHTSPLKENVEEYYHWHFEIMPRIIRTAGFERGSGFFINPTAPEDAARFMREVYISNNE